jgi:hypothetical protein
MGKKKKGIYSMNDDDNDKVIWKGHLDSVAA